MEVAVAVDLTSVLLQRVEMEVVVQVVMEVLEPHLLFQDHPQLMLEEVVAGVLIHHLLWLEQGEQVDLEVVVLVVAGLVAQLRELLTQEVEVEVEVMFLALLEVLVQQAALAS
jgi:hypothetical protein